MTDDLLDKVPVDTECNLSGCGSCRKFIKEGGWDATKIVGPKEFTHCPKCFSSLEEVEKNLEAKGVKKMTDDLLDNVPERFKLIIGQLREAIEKRDIKKIQSCLDTLDYPGAQLKFMTRGFRISKVLDPFMEAITWAFAHGFLTGARWGLNIE